MFFFNPPIVPSQLEREYEEATRLRDLVKREKLELLRKLSQTSTSKEDGKSDE